MNYSLDSVTELDYAEHPLPIICSAYYTPGYSLLPEEDSVSLFKRMPYPLASIESAVKSSVPFILVSSSSEYKLNILLSILLENKPFVSPIVSIVEMASTFSA